MSVFNSRREFFGPPLLGGLVRGMGRRKGLGAGGFATVDHSLMRGSSRMTTGSSQGCLALSASVGQKPLLDEAKDSPDLRPAPRLMRRRDVDCWPAGWWSVLGQQGPALVGGGDDGKVHSPPVRPLAPKSCAGLPQGEP